MFILSSLVGGSFIQIGHHSVTQCTTQNRRRRRHFKGTTTRDRLAMEIHETLQIELCFFMAWLNIWICHRTDMDQNAERVNPSSDPAEVGGLAESCHLLAECFSTPSLVFFSDVPRGRWVHLFATNHAQTATAVGCQTSKMWKKEKQRESCYHTVVLSMMVGMI